MGVPILCFIRFGRSRRVDDEISHVLGYLPASTKSPNPIRSSNKCRVVLFEFGYSFNRCVFVLIFNHVTSTAFISELVVWHVIRSCFITNVVLLFGGTLLRVILLAALADRAIICYRVSVIPQAIQGCTVMHHKFALAVRFYLLINVTSIHANSLPVEIGNDCGRII